jgi:MmyB-like transcription regulator ligand binding domain
VHGEHHDVSGDVIRLSLHPDGMRSAVDNFDEYAHHVVERLQRQLAQTADSDLADLLAEVTAYPGVPCTAPTPSSPDAVLALRVRVEGRALSLFSTIATIGAPLDATVAELAVEAFFPADEPTRTHFGPRATQQDPAPAELPDGDCSEQPRTTP